MKWWGYLLLSALLLVTGCGTDSENVVDKLEKEQTKPKPGMKAEAEEEMDRGIVPAEIEIPAIGVKAKVEPVGTLDNGDMEAPKDPDQVAWYEAGTQPGARGSAVISGHVDSKEGPAIFVDLRKLKEGDEITVRNEQGEERAFVVSGKRSFPYDQAPVKRIFGGAPGANLNLITCAGNYNRQAQNYEERLVVFTRLKRD